MTNKPDRQRLFFALWPEPETVTAIRQQVLPLLKEHDGRRVKPDNFHITLAFLGAVDTRQRACFSQAAGAVRGRPFQLQLNRLDYWPKPKVVWLGVETIPPELTTLQSDLLLNLQACGFEPEDRPYTPHLTLLRKAKACPEQTSISPLTMSVEDFALVESVSTPNGVEYPVRQRWGLTE